MEEVSEDKIRGELFELYKHYESVITGQLDFCYKYLNFYTGLLSAITAGTLTGILNIKSGELRGLALIIAPILTIFLAIIGYLNVRVFYFRFVQAWVTQINIGAMLNFKFTKSIKGIDKPLYGLRLEKVSSCAKWLNTLIRLAFRFLAFKYIKVYTVPLFNSVGTFP
ncbi:hypothetical protein AMR41_28315 [Hapalosiphon sp. MRB220]|nr:hypothetical protein AMR41_28315 [Hapalosiphon sp. MRB220]